MNTNDNPNAVAAHFGQTAPAPLPDLTHLPASCLLLVRHGETEDNARQIMQGQAQGKLNEAGIAQAEQLARQLAEIHIDAFVASDLRRSLDTCRIIARPHEADNAVTTTPLLRERDWGDFTGCYIPDLKGRDWPPNVEPMEQLMARAADFLAFIKKNYPDQHVLAVGHGIINKAIQAVYHHTLTRNIPPMQNAEVRILDLTALQL